ncbi:MAG: hypothetical protein K2J58_07090, partial [Muribaculaceae bacterium]|nr:hypothetical protein [Muribaculaceae bacterium]
PYIDGDTISYVQFATKHRFVLRGDTLSYIGYENRATDFRLDSPAVAAAFPLTDGKSVSDGWSGHMLHYGSMVLRHVRGVSASYIDGGWTLTDGTDTIRNATRLTWTLDMAYADPDSVTAMMPDSVASERISDIQVDVKAMLSERLLTERTMWFSADARYPVLTDSRVSRVILADGGEPADTVPLSMLAMYYPAPFQYSDTGEKILQVKSSGDRVDNGYEADGDGGWSLAVGEPEINGNTVTVTLSSQSGPIAATVVLFSDSGLRLTEPLTVTVRTVPQIYSVEAPSGWSGVMLLRVDTEEESHTRKIIR